mmetsp:Transcript_33424/g.87663  ORF Transcript_33424/g.87663 Transcript_33424/m.87663 type:complete len:185 (-) Transcript_33424:190-744(-)
MGAGISVRNESELPILVVCSQLTPLYWGRCDPGQTWNEKNSEKMGKVWFTVSVSVFDEQRVPTALGTAAKIGAISLSFVVAPALVFVGVAAVSGITSTRGISKRGVYANRTCLVVRGVKFTDGRYQFYFAAQEDLDPKTGAVKSTVTWPPPASVEAADEAVAQSKSAVETGGSAPAKGAAADTA